MKTILEICEFSAGICGVFTRVFEESKLLAKKGYKVYIFSSNIEKGTNKTAKPHETVQGIEIFRFPVKFSVGENALFWSFERQAIKIKPSIIIAHVYRHPHTNRALKIAKKLKAKCFLVTHAPFVDSKLRSKKLNLAVKLYDTLYRKNLNKFDKVIAITQWEFPFLQKLGVKKSKIAYIPNGIPEEFFKIKAKKPEKNKLLFLGRISPIKDLETLIKAFSLVKEKNFSVEIIGPPEKQYKEKLESLVKNLNFQNKVKFTPAIFDLRKKIAKLDSSEIFVLPSKREAMPQALIEAMSRGKVIIASNNLGSSDIIKDRKNGFLFFIGDEKHLASVIDFCFDNKNKTTLNKIKTEAKNTSKRFRWSKIINDIERTINL